MIIDNFLKKLQSLFDAEVKRSQQENVFPISLVYKIGEIAVKRHNLILNSDF